MESSSSKGSADEKIAALEQELTDAKADLQKAKDVGDKDEKIMYGNLVASIQNRLAALQKQAPVIPANDQSLSTFWSDLSIAEPNDMRILPLTTAPFLPENLSGLYVRQSYEKMYQIMNTKLPRIHRFAITGTPGIGKSMFLFYLMWKLSKLDSINAVILRRFKDDGEIYIFQKAICWVTFEYPLVRPLLNHRSTWYLTDALSPPPAEVRAVTVLVASPSKRHYSAFIKYPPAIALNYLPIWDLDELFQCAADLFPETDRPTIEERYSLIGGVPRFVLECPENNLQRRIAAGLGKLTIEKFDQIADGSLEKEDELSHVVVHFEVGQDLESYSLGFASLYVTERAFDRFNLHNRRKLLHFLSTAEDHPTVSSLRGQLFESFAHRQLCLGGTFKVAALTSHSPARTELTLPSMDVKRFKDICECCENNTYYLPISKRFACVDSAVPNIGFFQMTVSDRHPLKMDEMDKLLAASASHFPSEVYFVLPSNIYSEFQAQTYLTKEDRVAKKLKTSVKSLNQYSLLIDIPH